MKHACILLFCALGLSSPALATPRKLPDFIKVTVQGECYEDAYKFTYYPNAAFRFGDETTYIRPSVIDVNINGQSIPFAEMKKLNDWVGMHSIENATFYRCGESNDPYMAVFIQFKKGMRLKSNHNKEEGIFFIRKEGIEIDP